MTTKPTPLQAIKYALAMFDDDGEMLDCLIFLRAWRDGKMEACGEPENEIAAFVAANPDEPEVHDANGVARKAHYGEPGKQPWDLGVEAGWGPEFAALCALKYVRRAASKNGDDDLTKGRWYFARLEEFASASATRPNTVNELRARAILATLLRMLTPEEAAVLREK